MNIPKKYVPDYLTPSQKKKQIKSIKEGKQRPKLKNIPKRRSRYTTMAINYFGEGRSKEDIARKLSGGSNKRRKEIKKGLDEI